VIDSSQFLCLALASNRHNALSQVTNGSLATARGAALDACAKSSGMTCTIAYSGCND
jgi:hypothetical protein